MEQVKDMLPQIGLSVLMETMVYFFDISSDIKLLIHIPLEILIYWISSIVFHVESYTYITGMLKSTRKK